MPKPNLAKPMEIKVDRSGMFVVVVIEGAGSVTMPVDAAHQLARDLMKTVGDIQKIYPRAGYSGPMGQSL